MGTFRNIAGSPVQIDDDGHLLDAGAEDDLDPASPWVERAIKADLLFAVEAPGEQTEPVDDDSVDEPNQPRGRRANNNKGAS